MANQYTKLTAENIRIKMNRKKNPVRSVLQLAREFGVNTAYQRYAWWNGTMETNHRAPIGFVKRVKALVGEDTYNELRQSNAVPHIYR